MFKNREEAGLKLSQKLSSYSKKDNVLVLGIPRGGVITAKIVSEKLKLPLDVIVNRKIGSPREPELAIGAVGPKGYLVFDKALIRQIGVDKNWLKKEIKIKKEEVKEREKMFRKGRRWDLKGKIVILVDDGVATGSTTEVSMKYLRAEKVKKLILAVPVAPRDTIKRLSVLVDKVVVLETPQGFRAVGQFYQDFPQVTDEEVIQLLQ